MEISCRPFFERVNIREVLCGTVSGIIGGPGRR